MKRFKFAILIATLFALSVATSVFAGPAYQAPFTTSITYQNIGSAEANVVFTFYSENNGTGIDVSRTLAAGAGASISVGSLSEVSAGFRGSAVMSSDQPMVATMVQVSSDGDVKNRPLSNGFSAGSSTVLLPSVLKNQFNTTSRFSVQNVSDGPVDLTITLYNAANTAETPIVIEHNNLPAGAAQYFDMGTLSQISATSYNGSAKVDAVAAGTSNPANIVASVLELSTNGGAASSFEGVSQGASTVYMATALCNAFNATTFYAVQNPSTTTSADVTVTYSSGETATATVAPGAKASINACTAGNAAGFSGSATITAVETGTNTPANVVIIGKVSGGGNSTAFAGEATGAAELALPYVRFTQANWEDGTRQRAFVAIQNVGDTDLAAGAVTVTYLDKNGDAVGTHTLGAIPAGEKANTNPTRATGDAAKLAEFGTPSANPGGGFGGGAIVAGPAGSELIAVVRIQSNVGGGSVVGEDYNGIPTQ